MQFSEVKQVIEVNGSRDANAKLAQGWHLLAVVPGLQPTVQGASLTTQVVYVLGKPAEPEPPVPLSKML